MLRPKVWLEERAKYLSTAIFNKTQKQVTWETIYSRLYQSVKYENETKRLVDICEPEYREIRRQIWAENLPKKTNFDRITGSVETFADWIFKSYTNVPENVPCTVENCETTDRMDCKECFIEWLKKECDNEHSR
jgi:hypothetical protein